VKKIVRELHVSRNTVRKILRSNETDFTYERERASLGARDRQAWPCRSPDSASLCQGVR